MNRPWLLWIPLAVVAFIGGLAIYGLAVPKDEQVHSAMIGKKLPEFSLPVATAGVPPLAHTDMADGKPRLSVVEIGLMDETYVEIKSGVKQGDVVTTGAVETN